MLTGQGRLLSGKPFPTWRIVRGQKESPRVLYSSGPKDRPLEYVQYSRHVIHIFSSNGREECGVTRVDRSRTCRREHMPVLLAVDVSLNGYSVACMNLGRRVLG